MISYTANFEDVLLYRCFRQINNGFYIDIGAHHPTNASVTRWFYDLGWSGINVEPGEGIHALKAERARDINLEVAVADFEGETTFWVHSDSPGTSTLSKDIPQNVNDKAGQIKPVIVPVTTLNKILETYAANRHIHFLKIDVEGAENCIIQNTDWSRYRPEVVVVESTEPYTNIRRKEPWQETLQSQDFQMIYFDGVNDFWVREESSHLKEAFSIPVNVLDLFTYYDPEVAQIKSENAMLRKVCEERLALINELHAHASKKVSVETVRPSANFWQKLQRIYMAGKAK